MNDKTEYSKVTFVDVYYKGFHVGITERGETLATATQFTDQAMQMKVAIEKMIADGFEPSWNKQTNGDALTTKTTTAIPPTAPDLKIDGPQGQGGTCPVHNVSLVWKSGISKTTNKPFAFWACPEKLSDGSFCKG